jgi:hypothetical protein
MAGPAPGNGRLAAVGEIVRPFLRRGEGSWYGTDLVVVDPWFPSSESRSGCGGSEDGPHPVGPGLRCSATGLVLAREPDRRPLAVWALSSRWVSSRLRLLFSPASFRPHPSEDACDDRSDRPPRGGVTRLGDR